MTRVQLSKFDNSWYRPGRNALLRVLWYFANACILNAAWLPVSVIKVSLLRLFGARIGKGVNIKPSVNIKYPWRLTIGNDVWIGEKVWIDNLDDVRIEANCCLSQGALILCGNHDYRSESFDLVTGKIILEEGVWIGANATVCPGVTCHRNAVLSAGSVATKDLEENEVYQGNPAARVRDRFEPQPL